MRDDLPKRTVTLAEAQQMIGALVTGWVDWRHSSSRTPRN
jgi:hypothetical protein